MSRRAREKKERKNAQMRSTLKEIQKRRKVRIQAKRRKVMRWLMPVAIILIAAALGLGAYQLFVTRVANRALVPDSNDALTAVITTAKGTIELALYAHDAPKTVENFVLLSERQYYDGLKFHRVEAGFVIQGGDPKGDGTGGESASGGTFADELNTETESYKAGYLAGTLAMANSGANTNGSQFFITLADQPNLPHAYTIFGKVKKGLEVVSAIQKDDVMQTVRIVGLQ